MDPNWSFILQHVNYAHRHSYASILASSIWGVSGDIRMIPNTALLAVLIPGILGIAFYIVAYVSERVSLLKHIQKYVHKYTGGIAGWAATAVGASSVFLILIRIDFKFFAEIYTRSLNYKLISTRLDQLILYP